MNRFMRCVGLISAGMVGSLFAPAAANNEDSTVPYPQGYRQWTFLHATLFGPKTDIFGKEPCEKPCTGGIMYFYANDKAMKGLRTGKFPEGSIIADELLETSENEARSVAGEGARRGVGVMVKDSQRYASSGGWGYGSFDRDSRTQKLTRQERQACFQCHVSRKDNDYVFTKYRER